MRSLVKSERTLRIVELCAAAAVITFVLWMLQFSTNAICCGDFDGYYHIKWSRLLWESIRAQSFPPIFLWLPLTTLDANNYVDHHLLFHIFQIPFTWFGDLRFGAKLSATLFGSLALFSCYWLLVRYRVRFSLVWLVALLACSVPFLFRLNMAKAPPFAIIYLVIAIHLLFKNKYWPLLPLAFIFTATYDMFPLVLITVVFWTAVIGWTERRFEWRPLVWVLAGIIAGLVINPYFSKNLWLFYQHAKMKITATGYPTEVGGEWYPYNSWEFLGNSVVAVVAMVVGYVAFDGGDRKRAHHSLLLLLLATTLMILTARWKRMAEYWPPFAVMFAAFSLQPWLQGVRSVLTKLPHEVMDELQPFLDREGEDRPVQRSESRELWQLIAAGFVAIVLGIVLFFNLRQTSEDIGKSEPHDYYQAGAEWMRENIPSGEIIFNTDWDDFPRLFYFDHTHNYISGLDPHYLYDRDPALSKLYDRITLGEEEDPGPLIRDRFRSRYVFTDNRHDRFYGNAIESGWFEIIYEDDDCTILRILNEKGDSSAPEVEPEIEGEVGLEPESEP
ncbi:MAG TPA: hypothetical protein VJ023_05365 [Pyrinomonadaceae bacterium]|nr:hypothetical protein [Pyrinomonadaceae bacterium]